MPRALHRALVTLTSALLAHAAWAQDQPAHPVPESVRRLSWNTMFVMLVVLVIGTTVVLVILRRSTRRALGMSRKHEPRHRASPDPWSEAARRAEPEPVDPTRDIGEDRLAANDPHGEHGADRDPEDDE
ncbi:MAG: hypothetical protein RBS39_09730 [Phycisphaerales bacterium]|jgi:hypothetical protein|nr:hypothetical protein [Phycisphaerales bacterium]